MKTRVSAGRGSRRAKPGCGPSTPRVSRDVTPRIAVLSLVGARLVFRDEAVSAIGISPFAQNVVQVQGQVNGFACGDE